MKTVPCIVSILFLFDFSFFSSCGKWWSSLLFSTQNISSSDSKLEQVITCVLRLKSLLTLCCVIRERFAETGDWMLVPAIGWNEIRMFLSKTGRLLFGFAMYIHLNRNSSLVFVTFDFGEMLDLFWWLCPGSTFLSRVFAQLSFAPMLDLRIEHTLEGMCCSVDFCVFPSSTKLLCFKCSITWYFCLRATSL